MGTRGVHGNGNFHSHSHGIPIWDSHGNGSTFGLLMGMGILMEMGMGIVLMEMGIAYFIGEK